MNKKTYLVTGAAGFIGSRVAELLCRDPDNQVVGIDSLNDYYDVRLKEHRLHGLSRLENFVFEQTNVEDLPAISMLFLKHRFEAVVNLAARAGVRYSMEHPHVYHATNTGGNLNLLEEMRHHGVSKYVLASTSSLYAGTPMPFKESLAVNTPISPYAASKKAAELMAYSFHHHYGIDVSVVRYFTVFGPAGRPDMSYFRFIQAIHNGTPIVVYGDGNQSRDFTYVDDIARGTIAALRPLGYEIINLGGGRNPVSINSVIDRISNLLGRKAIVRYEPFHPADMQSTHADIEKANRLLDWEPAVSVDDGLASCVEWFKYNLPWSSQISCDACTTEEKQVG